MFLSKVVVRLFLFITVARAGLIFEIARGDAITRGAAVSRDAPVNNGSSKNAIEVPGEDANAAIPAYSIVFKFFSLIIGGVAVFTLVQVVILCCHDNKDVSFARVREPQTPPFVVFMRSMSKEDPDGKYKSWEYIDKEPLNGTKDAPMMSPLKPSR